MKTLQEGEELLKKHYTLQYEKMDCLSNVKDMDWIKAASIDLAKKENHLEDYLNLFEKYIDNNQKTKDTENKINFIKQQLIEDNLI